MNAPTRLLLVFCLSIGLFAPAALAQPETIAVFVGNQGNFSDANGTVSSIDPATLAVNLDQLPDLNTLVQSITLHEGTGFVMANTSDRIDLFSLDTRQRTGQIAGVPSPRYMTVVGEDKAYVSNLYDATVTIIRLSDASVQGTVDVGDNPEDIAVAGGRVYVANHGFGAGTTLSVIDPSSDTPLDPLEPGCDGPRMLAADLEQELWVVCTGNTVYNEDFTEIISESNGRVVVLDGATGALVTSFDATAQLGSGVGGQDAFYDPISRRLFVVQGTAILPFDTASNAALPAIDIPGDEAIGAVAYDDATARFYLGRITGFAEAGSVSIHDAEGREMARVAAGIIPSSIALQRAGEAVAVEEQPVDGAFALEAGYPNPFRGAVSIPFVLDTSGPVRVAVYDLLGREVEVLAEGVFAGGRHTVRWAPQSAPAGVYVVSMTAGERRTHTRITRIR
ncbi:MAG: T9SS type A sorting domain-containing protein [Rhodothermales bacterium]